MLRVSLALFAAMAAACGSAAAIEGASILRAVEAEPVSPAGPQRLKTPQGAVATTVRVPFARAGGVALVPPATEIELIGFHQASDVENVDMAPIGSAIRQKLLPSRSRPTGRHTAADIVVDPSAKIWAPVSGVVTRAGPYKLYCRYPDGFVVISPDGHPELEVKMLHVTGVRVRPGDRVVAGKTPVARHATRFPFGSQVDAYTDGRAQPHVHMEVTKLAEPSTTPEVGKSLRFGCP